MISRIVLVCVIAMLFYIIIPLSGRFWAVGKWKRFMARMRAEKGVSGCGTGYASGQLKVLRGAGASEAELLITPRKTVFFMLRKNENIEALAWRTTFLLQNGTTLYYIQSKKRFVRSICIFYEDKNEAALIGRLSTLTLPEHIHNAIKPYSIALGAFLEFIVFLDCIQTPEMSSASIAALVAIFGKALPYCPPGLFLTLLSQLPGKKGKMQKKSRQLNAAGILLEIAGIGLNIAVIFFVIRNISF